MERRKFTREFKREGRLMMRQGVAFLREITQNATTDERTIFAAGRLRFVLEILKPGKTPEEVASEMAPVIVAYLGSDRFELQPLFDEADVEGVVFLVLAISGVERTLPPDLLYGIASDLRTDLDLISCEPDIGANVFVDPEADPPPGVESAIVDATCWATDETPPDKLWALKNIGVLKAWEISPAKGSGIRIAQPDTGITDHGEVQDANLELGLALNILDGGTNPLDPLKPGTSNPGHGTATGSVAASGEAGDISGAAPKAGLVPIRCIEDVKIFDGSPVAKAVDHAVKIGAHVITMSLGGIWSRSLRKAIRRAVERDIIVVAAAGNCIGLVVWPAAFDDVIAVGGTNIADKKWKGSSTGSKVDFSAPAESVWRADRKQASDPPAKVSGGQGTSFAVALTAGVAALWLAKFGRATVIAEARKRSTNVQELFRSAVRQTARRPARWDSTSLGAGIVNAEALLQLSLSQLSMSKTETIAGDGRGFESALSTVLGPGSFDSRFDWAAHGAEVSSILLADAKVGRNAAEGWTEARAFRRASEGLAGEAAGARDPRIAQLALRSGLAAPALIMAEAPERERLGSLIRRLGSLSQPGTGPESAASIGLETAQARLGEEGREAILKPLTDRLKAGGLKSAATEIDQAREAIDRLHSEGVAARLSDSTTVQLEALVSLTERPALPVSYRHGDAGRRLQTVNANDPALGRFGGFVNLALADLEAERFPSVGRIDGEGIHIGTGFVVGDGLIMTNRHVLESFASPLPKAENPSRWLLHGDATIDFSPAADDAGHRFAITDVVFAGARPILGLPIDYEKLDLALLRVETTNPAGKTLPVPIPLVAAAGLSLKARNLFVIGYPAAPAYLPRDEKGMIRRDVVDRLREIFGLKYGRKYFSPGVVQSIVGQWVFDHDATTLGGNSGSLIGDFGEGLKVIGLHFAGDWLRANHAHSIAEVSKRERAVAALFYADDDGVRGRVR